MGLQLLLLSFQVDLGIFAEDMANITAEGEVDLGSGRQSRNFCTGHIHSGNNDNNILACCIDVQVNGGTHQLVNFDGSLIHERSDQ